MVSVGDFIALSDRELADGTIDIGRWSQDAEHKYRLEITEAEKSFSSKGEPYCRACALEDFKEVFSKFQEGRKRQAKNPNYKAPVTDLKVEFKGYGGKYFEKIKESVVWDKPFKGGPSNIPVTFIDYRCPRGHGCSVQLKDKVEIVKK